MVSPKPTRRITGCGTADEDDPFHPRHSVSKVGDAPNRRDVISRPAAPRVQRLPDETLYVPQASFLARPRRNIPGLVNRRARGVGLLLHAGVPDPEDAPRALVRLILNEDGVQVVARLAAFAAGLVHHDVGVIRRAVVIARA